MTMETVEYDPGGLIAGDYPLAHRSVTIAESAALKRGAVLGLRSLGAASSEAKAGGNTGNGTFVLDEATPVRPGAKPGVYTLRCIAAATNAGTFALMDPDGFALGQYTITGGAGGTVTIDNDIKGVLTDGSTDFAVGDGFDVTVAAGSDKYVLSASAAVDGSADPVAVLAEDADASEGDAVAPVFFSGEFAADRMIFGTGHTAASVDAIWRKAGKPLFVRPRA